MSRSRNTKSPKRKRALYTGKRVYLRRPAPGDCEEFLSAMRASRSLHSNFVFQRITPDYYAQLLRRGRQQNCERHFVCRNDDDVIVGQVNLNEIVRGFTQSAYIGYYGFEPHTRQGYMAEGITLVISRAFHQLKLHRVEAGIQPNNSRSIALVKRLGFRYEGTATRLIKLGGRWRDHQRWAILAEEWHPSTINTK